MKQKGVCPECDRRVTRVTLTQGGNHVIAEPCCHTIELEAWQREIMEPGEFEKEERAIRDQVLKQLAHSRKEIVAWLRAALTELFVERCMAGDTQGVSRDKIYVTADDARLMLTRIVLPEGLNLNFMGAIFKTSDWEATGDFVVSGTKGRHGNRIFCWRYVGTVA